MKLWKWTGGRQDKCHYRKFTLWYFKVWKLGFDAYILDYEPNQILPTHRDPIEGGSHYRLNIGWGKSLFLVKSKIWGFKRGNLSVNLFRPDLYNHSLVINGHTRKLSLGFVKFN
jgi:hypothetical protein